MFRQILLFFFFIFSALAGWACASCGCTLSANWEEASATGFKLDLRYDYIDQNQLRSGTSTTTAAAASQMVNSTGPQEVEKYTINQYVTAMAEYTIDPAWKLSLQVPYVIRDHSTLGTNTASTDGATGGPGGGQYTSNTSSLGDMKIIARYQGMSQQHNFGVLFGLKLPTGRTNLTGTSTDPTVSSPQPIDRGLQPGTGTTDLIYGLYYTQALDKNWDYFTEGIFQSALNTNNQYRPGDGLNLNFGLRYMSWDSLRPQLQINARYVQTDSGGNADTISTGGTMLYLSPGLTALVSSGLSVYGYVQLPMYQNLDGVQLAPTYTASLGTSYSF